jgi:hypothetical protein
LAAALKARGFKIVSASQLALLEHASEEQWRSTVNSPPPRSESDAAADVAATVGRDTPTPVSQRP